MLSLILTQSGGQARQRAPGITVFCWVALSSVALLFLTPSASRATDGWPQGRVIDAGPVHHSAPAPERDAGADQARATREDAPREPAATPPSPVSSCVLNALGGRSEPGAGTAFLVLLVLARLQLRRRGDVPAKPSADGSQAT